MTSSMPEPETFPLKPRSTKKKWYAIIIVLILILSSFAILSLLHPSRLEPVISVDTASNYLQAGDNYTLALKADESYKNITVEWGDNQKTTLNYTGTTLSLSHVYKNPGIYYINYWANFSSGLYKSNTYIPVYVEYPGYSNGTVNGIITILNSSKPSVVANSNIYSPGTVLNIIIGNISSYVNSSFKVSQLMSIYHNGTIECNKSGASAFSLNLSEGYYILKLSTVTTNASKNYTTYYYMDMPINPQGILYINTVTDSIVVDSITPYTNLNPQEAYAEADLQILYNTEQFLMGDGTSGYFPEIASNFPSVNGNSYTFNINGSIVFQNGIHMDAYDVYYSLVLDLLLENRSPETPGWILAQYLLPGNYHNTNNYTNIMKAITYSNSTDTVTLNFTVPLSPHSVYGLLSSPGTFISSASYLSRNGENISFTAEGFHYFKVRKSNYTMKNILSDGPYEIEKSVIGSYITLVRNPDFKGNKYNPAPRIDSITINYKNSYSSMYQDMRFNTSQIAIFPASYPYMSHISGISAYNMSYNLSKVYNFNANINETLLGKIYAYSNLPPNLFSNITVRKAFYEAYPGHNLTLAHILWHSFITNATQDLKYHLTNVSQYKGKPLVIPLFTESGISSSNISKFSFNLVKMIGNGTSFPIVLEPDSFIDNYILAGDNPMPIYEETLPEMNSSLYYAYIGDTMNFTHSYNNGFNFYSFNITDKNQSVLMQELNSNISKLIYNLNNKNTGTVNMLIGHLYMYIFPKPGNVEMRVYYHSYITMNNPVTGYGVLLFNNIGI